MADFTIKRGDRLPTIVATLYDAAGAAVNLTSTTVVFLMTDVTADMGSTPKVSAVATPDADQTTNRGRCEYAWATDDTDTAGRYRGEFEVTFSSGKKETFPNRGYLLIAVVEDLG